eukprot:scaffold33250_cov65-Phaeocystis_antarctica.AAC.2
MARSELVLTLPMPIFVDDCGLYIGCDDAQVAAVRMYGSWADLALVSGSPEGQDTHLKIHNLTTLAAALRDPGWDGDGGKGGGKGGGGEAEGEEDGDNGEGGEAQRVVNGGGGACSFFTGPACARPIYFEDSRL